MDVSIEAAHDVRETPAAPAAARHVIVLAAGKGIRRSDAPPRMRRGAFVSLAEGRENLIDMPMAGKRQSFRYELLNMPCPVV